MTARSSWRFSRSSVRVVVTAKFNDCGSSYSTSSGETRWLKRFGDRADSVFEPISAQAVGVSADEVDDRVHRSQHRDQRRAAFLHRPGHVAQVGVEVCPRGQVVEFEPQLAGDGEGFAEPRLSLTGLDPGDRRRVERVPEAVTQLLLRQARA